MEGMFILNKILRPPRLRSPTWFNKDTGWPDRNRGTHRLGHYLQVRLGVGHGEGKTELSILALDEEVLGQRCLAVPIVFSSSAQAGTVVKMAWSMTAGAMLRDLRCARASASPRKLRAIRIKALNVFLKFRILFVCFFIQKRANTK